MYTQHGEMSPRERFVAAIKGEAVDYIPCSIYFNTNLALDGYDCSRPGEATRLALDLGTDPFIYTDCGHGIHPEVKVDTWIEDIDGCEILKQSWDTPEGTVTQALKITDDLPDKKRIVWSDHSASNLYEPLVKSADDVKCIKYIYAPIEDAQLQKTREGIRETVSNAHKRELPVVCQYGLGLGTFMFMMGAENAVYFAMDHEDAFTQVAEDIHQTEMRNIELAAECDVDVLKRFGGYEQTNFYNVEIFEEVVMPRLKREVQKAHELGLLIYYRVVTGMEPLLDKIASIGFDCIEGGEPRLSGCDFKMWHDAFGGKASSWTGISSPVLLGGDDEQAVRAEVRLAVETFGNRGFMLGVTNSIRRHFKWENTLAMIDEWKKVRA